MNWNKKAELQRRRRGTNSKEWRMKECGLLPVSLLAQTLDCELRRHTKRKDEESEENETRTCLGWQKEL